MKRLLCLSIAVMIVANAHLAAPQVEFPLPESHWSYSAMAALAAAGLAPGFEYADFDGRRTFTREDMARAAAAARDFFSTSPSLFSSNHLELLDRLQNEFRDELERLGIYRPLPATESSPPVPPGHWAYAALEKFAAVGFFPDTPAHQFSGGKILTREEMAAFAAQLLQRRASDPSLFNEEQVRLLGYLEIEFQAELRNRESPPIEELKQERAAPPFAVSGTGNFYAGVTKGDKASITGRLTLDADSPRMETYFSGDLDNAERSGTDLDFGRGYTFQLNRKLIGYHSNKSDADNDRYLLAGDINSIDFDRGLIAGALNIKGVFASSGSPAARTTALWGEDTEGNEIAGARFVRRMGDDTRIAAVWLREYTGARELAHAAGVSMERGPASRRITLDLAAVQGAGRGAYASWSGAVSHSARAIAEYRYYRDFTAAHNNPPRYLGRSGGNGENEKSYHLRLEWTGGRRWAYILARDHAHTPENGSRTNVFFAQEFRPSKIWALAWSMEKETGAGAADTERGVRARYTGFRGVTLAGSWKRAVRPGSPSSTTRLDITTPILDEVAQLLLSFTRRKASTTRTHSYRARLSRRLARGDSLSVSYDYTATAANRMDLSYTWKY